MTLEIANFDEMWGMLTAGAPPVQVFFDRIGSTVRDRLRDVLAGIAEQRFGSGSIRLTNAATVGRGAVG